MSDERLPEPMSDLDARVKYYELIAAGKDDEARAFIDEWRAAREKQREAAKRKGVTVLLD